jgi:uncharacterized protein (TIGR02246 family)
VSDTDGAVEHVRTYARTCDLLDPDRVAALFAPDAELRAGSTCRGSDEIAAYYRSAFASMAETTHHVLDPHAEVVEGSATSLVRVTATFVAEPVTAAGRLVIVGSYDDLLRRAGDGWRFVEKANTVLLTLGPYAAG